jgi:hypothetical protein
MARCNPLLGSDSRFILTWLLRIFQVMKKVSQGLGVFGPLLNSTSGLSVRNGVLLYKQLIRSVMDYDSGSTPFAATLGSCRFYSPSVFTLLLVHVGTSVTDKFTTS